MSMSTGSRFTYVFHFRCRLHWFLAFLLLALVCSSGKPHVFMFSLHTYVPNDCASTFDENRTQRQCWIYYGLFRITNTELECTEIVAAVQHIVQVTDVSHICCEATFPDRETFIMLF